ncbi:MAG: hypothetical protein JSS04_29155 [Proteobacteria bacterium]|nr:hypothetical protein [Pseudomonadota bacterium]
MAIRKKKTSIVGAVADSVTEAVSTAIGAIAHPADTVQQAVAVARRKVAARRPASKAAKAKQAVRKAVKKAAKKVRR